MSSSPTALLFSKEVKRELKYLAKPDLGSTLVAVGWTVDGASAPGCIQVSGKCLVALARHVLPLGQRQGPGVCCSSLALHSSESCSACSGRLHSMGSPGFPPPSVREGHGNVFKVLPAVFSQPLPGVLTFSLCGAC